MVQLSIIFKENPSLIASGVAMAGAFLHNKYARVTQHSWQKFAVTNALVSLSAMFGMVAKTSSLGWGVRAFSVLSSGAATMIPTVWHVAKLKGVALATHSKEL